MNASPMENASTLNFQYQAAPCADKIRTTALPMQTVFLDSSTGLHRAAVVVLQQ